LPDVPIAAVVPTNAMLGGKGKKMERSFPTMSMTRGNSFPSLPSAATNVSSAVTVQSAWGGQTRTPQMVESNC
jgi:hypothetical protein